MEEVKIVLLRYSGRKETFASPFSPDNWPDAIQIGNSFFAISKRCEPGDKPIAYYFETDESHWFLSQIDQDVVLTPADGIPIGYFELKIAKIVPKLLSDFNLKTKEDEDEIDLDDEDEIDLDDIPF